MAHPRRTAPMQALPLAGYSGHLQAAEVTFRLLTTGPRPLAVDGRAIGHGLPRRMIPLDELSSMLLHPSTSQTARDAAWRVLVTRARTGSDEWIVGAAGVAAAGLWRAVKRLTRSSAADHADVQSEVMRGFLDALAKVDLTRPGVCSFLRRHAYKTARSKLPDAEPAASGESSFAPASTLPPPQWGHPDILLARAVKLGVITAEEAELIGATRLEQRPITEYAQRAGCRLKAAYKRRDRAEERLVAALAAGSLSDPRAEVIAEAVLTVVPEPPTPHRQT